MPHEAEQEPPGAVAGPSPSNGSTADPGLVALALFHDRLRTQHAACDHAFASLRHQVAEAMRAQGSALALGGHGQQALSPLYFEAATGVATAANILFRYLFEALFAHQTGAGTDLAAQLEAAARHHLGRTGGGGGDGGGSGTTSSTAVATAAGVNGTQDSATVTVTAAARLLQSLHALRQAPAAVQQAQRELLPEVPLMVPAPTAAAASHKSTGLARSPRKAHPTPPTQPAKASGATGQPPNTQQQQRSTAAARTPFAISSGYPPPVQVAIAALVLASYRRPSVVLPAASRETEEALAAAAGCCCLVTERPAPAAGGTTAALPPVRRATWAYLRSFLPKPQGKEKEEKEEGGPVAAEAERISSSVGPEGSAPVIIAAAPAAGPPGPQADDHADRYGSDGDEASYAEDEEDAELMALLDTLDEAVLSSSQQHGYGYGYGFGYGYPGGGLPALSQRIPSQSQQSGAACADLSADGLASQLMSGHGGGGPGLVLSLRGLSSSQHRTGRGKRPRAFIEERASATQTSAEGSRDAARRQRHAGADSPADDSGGVSSAAVEEWEVIPSQLSSAMESQQVVYIHRESDCSAAGGLSGATDANNELERALLLTRPPEQWVFQISNSCKERRRELVEAIRRLGGEVDTGSLFNPATTHLVVAEGLTERTEKYLSACAGGRFIVPPRYVLESDLRGHWLLGCMDVYNRNPLRRCFPPAGGLPLQPFAGWRVLLLVSQPSVASGIGTVLRAGGCKELQVFIFNGTEAPTDEDAEEEEEGGDGGGGTGAQPPRVTLSEATAVMRVSPRPPAVAALVGASPDGSTAGLTRAAAFDPALPAACTHLLVECLAMSAEPENPGNFTLPLWMPPSLTVAGLYPRTFTLELLYYCLCTSAGRVFDDAGTLLSEDALVAACRVEPYLEAV